MPPSLIDLTWLNAVKQRASANVDLDTGAIAAGQDDDEIQAAITGFSRSLLNRTGLQSLNSIVTMNEIRDGNGNNRMMLKMIPGLSLTSVSIYGINVPISDGPLNWGAYMEQSGKSIALRSGAATGFTRGAAYAGFGGGLFNWRGPVFTRGTGNVLLSYQAGFQPLAVENEIETILAQTITLQRAPWVADISVLAYPSLAPMVKVANTPSPGQYSVSNGLYVFNVADNENQVAVSYQVNAAPEDLEYAVRCVVSINYKRKGWQDQKSKGITTSTGGGATTSYQNWKWPPEYEEVFQFYTRLSAVN